MRDNKDKKIGSAMYLNKSNGQYIPIRVRMNGTDCTLIKPMLDEAFQRIGYINKDNIK